MVDHHELRFERAIRPYFFHPGAGGVLLRIPENPLTTPGMTDDDGTQSSTLAFRTKKMWQDSVVYNSPSKIW